MKKIIDNPKHSQMRTVLAVNKLKRLINEVVLLQYKIKITRILLLSFLDATNKILDSLEEVIKE